MATRLQTPVSTARPSRDPSSSRTGGRGPSPIECPSMGAKRGTHNIREPISLLRLDH